MTVLLNTLLVLALLFSAQLAGAWAELGSYPLHGDNSSLAGFGSIVIVMPIRWGLLAIVLAAGVSRGSFAGLPGGRGLQTLIVVGAHLALGVLAYQVFDWILRGVQQNDGGPQRVAIVFGVIVPAVVWLGAFVSVNRGWVVRHPVMAVAIVALVLAAHLAGWRNGLYPPR